MTVRRRASLARHVAACLAASAALVGATSLGAQDRLVGLRAAAAGVTVETMRFGGGGIVQGTVAGDSLRVRSASQFSVPMTVAVPLGEAWTIDVTSVYTSGSVAFDAVGGQPAASRRASLSGLSDVRVRASGRLAGDGVVITAGLNAPTGRTRLDAEQLTAVRVLAAPSLGLGTPPVGAGPSGTVGLLVARGTGRWALAGGLSYELHGNYTPIGALVTSGPATDYRPGSVVHASIGADGLVGRRRLSLSAAADFYGTDQLRATNLPGTPSGTALARVQLGPIFSTDAQLFFAVPRVREAVLWVSNRWRANFARDGVTVPGSSGNYLDGGFRTSVPLTRQTDVLLATDGRWQTGLDFDDALLTASSASAGLTLGVSHRRGKLTIQPFVRGQAGRVRTNDATQSGIAGGAAGLTILTRF